jgi:hypothetical protein
MVFNGCFGADVVYLIAPLEGVVQASISYYNAK